MAFTERLMMAEKVAGFPSEDEPDYTEQFKVFSWRLDVLMAAGFDGPTATTLASRRDVDLHGACDLAARAGADQAANILI